MRRVLPEWLRLRFRSKKNADLARSLRTARMAADAARDQRDWAGAARAYEEFIAIDPRTLHVTVQLGHAYKEMGEYDRAAELYFSVLTLRPDDADLHLQIGHLQKLRGDYAQALHHYRTAMDLDPLNSDARHEFDELKGANPVAALGTLGHLPTREEARLHAPVGANAVASFGLVARSPSVVCTLPRDQNAASRFVRRVAEIEQFITGPRPR